MMRPATTQEIHKILTSLFLVLPPRGITGTDFDAAISGYMVALEGVTFDALRNAARDILQGMEGDLSAKVCPTAPELSRAVRKRMAATRRLELLSTTKPWHPAPFISLEARQDAARQRMAAEGRRHLCDVNSDTAAAMMAKKGVQDGTIPAGSLYVGILGAFYSPKGAAR